MENQIEYSKNAGHEFANQIASDVVNYQNGPGKMTASEDLPEFDYIDLKTKFGSVTPEMETAYRAGYNSVADSVA